MSDVASKIAILTAILALAGTVITALLGSAIITRFYYPVVEIMKESIATLDGHKLRLTVTNYGSEPATNMTLFIKSPSRIHNVSNVFSTSTITLPQLNDSLLMMNNPVDLSDKLDTDFITLDTQKFTQGTGSKLILDITDEGGTLDDYVITAVYDQGSATAISTGDWTFKSFIEFTRNPIFLVALIIGSLGSAILFSIFRNRLKSMGIPAKTKTTDKTDLDNQGSRP